MSEPTPTSFRLRANEHQQLEDYARQAGLGSANMAARKIVLDHLKGEASSPLMESLRKIHAEVNEARTDLSLAAAVLLAHAGKLSEAESTSWVNENLKPH